jgi:shikimate dehydrogenase
VVTKLVALFGFPIEHTLSPLFQNAAFKVSGTDAVYVAFEVTPDDLENAVQAIRSLKFLGANLTIPHKEKVIPFLDEISPMSQKCGSVNTIVNRNGKLRGETTDGLGFLRSLKEGLGITPKEKRILLVGAGGAARAIAFVLAEAKASLYLTDLIKEKGKRLVNDLNKWFPQNKSVFLPLSERSAVLRREKIDILINATPVGLKKEEALFRTDDLTDKLVVCDLIYNRKTLLLQSAQKLGLKTINGMGMLIHQGALSFQLWTGKTAPVKAMFAAVKHHREI